MPEIFIYLLKVNIALSLFYFGYYSLLKKLTFYSLNRFYLLFSIFVSAAFPFLRIPSFFSQPEIIYFNALPIEKSMEILPQSQETSSYTLWFILLGAYWLFVALGGIKLLTRLLSLYRIYLKSTPQLWEGYNFNNLTIDTAPFSFLSTIYLNFEKHTEKELYTILKHEEVHTKNFHSFDILIVEIWCIFSWFNPISWWLRKTIKVNIEFIADHEVIQQGIAHDAYQNSLLHLAVQSQNLPLANQFSFLSLKSRINMMNKKQSSKKQLGKYFLVIPVIISSLFLFGVSKAYKTDVSAGIIFQELGNQPERVKNQDTILTPKSKVESAEIILGIEDHTASDISDPLIVIDGEATIKGLEEVRANISADDIKSITVLKGQDASSIYGNKAKSGVIEISTKLGGHAESRGSKDKRIIIKKTITLGGDTLTELTETERSIVKKEGSGRIALRRIPRAELKDSVTVSTEARAFIVRVNSEPSATTKGKAEERVQILLNSSDAKSQPVYIVNGKELDPSEFKKIVPSQIESISVLKGESAKKVYGEKGANGIIEIQLK